MKKITFIWFLCLLSLILFSCNDNGIGIDDAGKRNTSALPNDVECQNLLVGKWVDNLNIIATYSKDSTYTIDFGAGEELESGNFYVKNGILITINPKGELYEQILRLDSKKLQLSFIDSDEKKEIKSDYSRLQPK